MTERTPHRKSPIEKATEQVLHDLQFVIAHQHRKHALPLPEREFRTILAGYFANKSDRQWCEDLGVDPPEGA